VLLTPFHTFSAEQLMYKQLAEQQAESDDDFHIVSNTGQTSFMAFPSKLQAQSLCSQTCGPEGMHHKNNGREQSSSIAQTYLVISSELPLRLWP